MAEASATLNAVREIAGEETNLAMTPAMTSAMTPTMTPEDKLCLLLARGQLSAELQKQILEYLASPLQWPLVLERAYAHQVYPLLYRNLRELGFPAVPQPVQAELKGAYLANALRNQLFAEELARLLKLLGEAGIPVIPLKGVALAQSLYGDPAARVCSDIDILVPPAKVTQAMNLIPACGYRSDFDDPFFSQVVRRHGRHYEGSELLILARTALEIDTAFLPRQARSAGPLGRVWFPNLLRSARVFPDSRMGISLPLHPCHRP